MHCLIASCALASPLAGRSNAKLRRSPFTEYCRAGNVTFLPPSRRSHTPKPMRRSPWSGPVPASKITSASASFPLGLPLSFGRIRTDTTSPLPSDMMGLHETPRVWTGGVGYVHAGRYDARNKGGTHGPAVAHAWTKL